MRRDWGKLWSRLLHSKKKTYALWELMWPWTEIYKKTLSNPWNLSLDWKLWQTQIGRKTQRNPTSSSSSGDDQPLCIFSGGDPSRSSPGMSRTHDLPFFVSHAFPFLHLFISFPLSASSPMDFSLFISLGTQQSTQASLSQSAFQRLFFLSNQLCLFILYMYVYLNPLPVSRFSLHPFLCFKYSNFNSQFG